MNIANNDTLPLSVESLEKQAYRVEHLPQSGLHISFGWTFRYLASKTQTRRKWKDSHAQKFINAFHKGASIKAYDKDPRYKGECILTREPYQQLISEMPSYDLIKEGGMCNTVQEFVDKYFAGNANTVVWVVDFEFIGNEKWEKLLHTADFSPESEDLKKPSALQEEGLLPNNSSKSTQTHSKFSETNIPESPSTQTLETTTAHMGNSTFSQSPSPAQEHPMPEPEPDSNTPLAAFGLKPCDASEKESQDLLSSSNQKELSIKDYEQCLEDCEWQDIRDGIYNSFRLRKLELATTGTESLLLPTPTAQSPTGSSRPAGQTKLEKWFRDNGLLQTSQCLSGEVMELLMGFPLGWTSALLESKKEAKEGTRSCSPMRCSCNLKSQISRKS